VTNYNLQAIIPPSLVAKEKKAARKKLLEEVRKRRYQIATQRRIKEQNAYNSDEDFREYQDRM